MMTTHSPTWASCVHPLLGMMILCKILIYKDLKGIRRMLHEVENVTIRFLNLVLRTVPVSMLVCIIIHWQHLRFRIRPTITNATLYHQWW